MPPPRGGGRLLRNLNDNYAHSGALNGTENLTPQEQLFAGTLELDPENDPVICTTESGLEIKFAQAFDLGTGGKFPNTESIGGQLQSGAFNGYAYLKMGKYNWIIIGYNSSSASITVNYDFDAAIAFSTYLASPSTYKSFAGSLETSTDAGIAIYNAASNGSVYAQWALSLALDYSAAVLDTSNLSSGQALVLCENTTGETTFKDKSGNGYNGSNLQTSIRNLYYPSTNKNDAEFTNSEANLIVLTTSLPSASGSGGSSDEYLFALAGRDEKFNFDAYLGSSGDSRLKRGDAPNGWWTRSGTAGSGFGIHYISSSGSLTSTNSGHTVARSVLPAMVINIS